MTNVTVGRDSKIFAKTSAIGGFGAPFANNSVRIDAVGIGVSSRVSEGRTASFK
jgi:hypothetical protein